MACTQAAPRGRRQTGHLTEHGSGGDGPVGNAVVELCPIDVIPPPPTPVRGADGDAAHTGAPTARPPPARSTACLRPLHRAVDDTQPPGPVRTGGAADEGAPLPPPGFTRAAGCRRAGDSPERGARHRHELPACSRTPPGRQVPRTSMTLPRRAADASASQAGDRVRPAVGVTERMEPSVRARAGHGSGVVQPLRFTVDQGFVATAAELALEAGRAPAFLEQAGLDPPRTVHGRWSHAAPSSRTRQPAPSAQARGNQE
ncbi:hypothetical protein SCYAM73S_04348 [Streptomyces cyaneofuscatus]